MDRLAAGDRAALVRVTRMIAARLRRLGAYDLHGEWEDLSQDVVWALVRAVRDGRAPQPERTAGYVGAVVYNHFVNRLRSRNAHPDQQAGSYAEDETMPNHVGTHGAAAVHDERLAARLALASLPEEWQSLLIAHHVEGHKIDALVSSGERSRASVNRDLKRAREAFRAALLGEDGDGRAAALPADDVSVYEKQGPSGKNR